MPVRKKMKMDNGHCCPKDDTCPVCRTPAPGTVYDKVCEVECTLNGKCAKAILDSGSQMSIITIGMLKKMDLWPKLNPVRNDLRMFCGGRIKITGVFEAIIEIRGRSFKQDVHVLNKVYEQLVLGTNFSSAARLVIDFYAKSVCFRDEYVNNGCDETEVYDSPLLMMALLECPVVPPLLSSMSSSSSTSLSSLSPPPPPPRSPPELSPEYGPQTTPEGQVSSTDRSSANSPPSLNDEAMCQFSPEEPHSPLPRLLGPLKYVSPNPEFSPDPPHSEPCSPNYALDYSQHALEYEPENDEEELERTEKRTSVPKTNPREMSEKAKVTRKHLRRKACKSKKGLRI